MPPPKETLTVRKERVLLMGVLLPGEEEPEPLGELAALVESAGGVIAGRMLQSRPGPDPATYVGKGKTAELKRLALLEKADAVVADHELTSAQVNNLEKALDLRVFDRSELIMDIFAIGAKSQEAKLQVELAQLQYGMTRLKRAWTHLDRIGGGIGARGGVGETQLEIDRRLVRRRIGLLQQSLSRIQARHAAEASTRAETFAVCLVGYTNAGKSMLMRRLTGYEARSEDRLFSTLDTRTRRALLDHEVLVSDTVGFIRKLPHRLVASFRATLQEVLSADLLLHVIDASSPDAGRQAEAVEEVLAEIGARAPIWRVWNKIDRLDGLDRAALGGHRLSALSGEGVGALLEAVDAEAGRGLKTLEISCRMEDGEAQAALAAAGRVLSRTFDEDRTLLTVELTPAAEKRLRRWSDAGGRRRLGFPA